MNDLLPFAKKMLTDYGEFFPFGGYTKPTGDIVHVGAKSGDRETPKSADLATVLEQSLLERAQGGECKATAILFNVTIRRGDAIQVNVDHKAGYSAQVFIPYAFDGNAVVYGEVFAQEGDHRIFGNKESV